MSKISLNLLELKVRPELIERSLCFYGCLGLDFGEHKIERGPVFYVAKTEGGATFKIYPLERREGYPMPHARLGFSVESNVVESLQSNGFECFERDYGFVTKDPMGRYIELHTNN